MRRRNRLAWKLSVVILVIVSLVILGTGWLGSMLSRQYALDAARRIMKFNSASITSAMDELMMSHNDTGAFNVIEKMSNRSATYQDISLISHPEGRVVVSRNLVAGTQLTEKDRICTICHITTDRLTVTSEARDEVIDEPGGDRFLQVVTPVFNQPGCRNASCHSHAESGTVLGFLRTEYALTGFDDLMTRLNLLLTLAALLAIVLVAAALLIMFRWFLGKPLRGLVAGINIFADGDFEFRFTDLKDDEIGLVEDSFNDMADQIQAHRTELHKARDYLEGIVEHSADIIITVNTRGRIMTYNNGAEQSLGYKRTEVLGQRIEMLFDDPQERDTAIARLQEQDNVTNWETRFRTKDGKICNVLMSLSRLRNRNSELIGTVGISKDITIEKELQQKLIQSEQAAAIGRAVTAIQHAIKNMLNTLRGGIYVIRVGAKKDQPEQIEEGCVMVDEGLSQIKDLAHNMLKYARQWKIEPESVDMAGMAGKIATAIGQNAQERGVAVYTEAPNSLPEAYCDPSLIHMGLMDIISNAVDACELKDYSEGEEPEIRIRVLSDPGEKSVVVQIRDNGIGMTPEVVENIFTPFFSTKKKWGTGLGLAITKRIIDLHDGKITVESELGKGAEFQITLPLKNPP